MPPPLNPPDYDDMLEHFARSIARAALQMKKDEGLSLAAASESLMQRLVGKVRDFTGTEARS